MNKSKKHKIKKHSPRDLVIQRVFALALVLTFTGSAGWSSRAIANSNKGIGPVKELKLDPLDEAMATKGKENFINKCSACHKMEERYVGPALKGVTGRRSSEWVMNMILNPQEMTQKDPDAQALMEEFLMQMPFQNVTTEETRAILEYFRHYDTKGDVATANANGKEPTKGKEAAKGGGKAKK